jgi:hypothetical protein
VSRGGSTSSRRLGRFARCSEGWHRSGLNSSAKAIESTTVIGG